MSLIPNTSLMLRLTRCFLASILLLTQTNISDATGDDLWTQRRQAIQQRTSKVETRSSMNAASSVALAQLASISSVRSRLPAPMSAVISPRPSVGRQAEPKKSPAYSYLSTMIALLSADGQIREVRPASDPVAPVIFLFEDVHDNKEAQQRLSGLVTKAVEYDPEIVLGLEGAWGPVPIERFRLGDAAANAEVASFFLNIGYIAGPEFAALSIPRTVRVVGAEDRRMYLSNVAALKASLPRQETLLRIVSEWKRELGPKKSAAFSKELMELDGWMTGFNSGSLELGGFLS